MENKTLILIGSTGAVGQEVLKQALDHPDVSQVKAYTRRPLGQTHPKLVNQVLDFDNLPDTKALWHGHAVICTLGTTIKIAKTPEAFQHVDLHLPAKVAALSAQAGTACFVLNSSLMANPNAKGFYLRTKGLAEQAVKEAGFDSVVLARPGLLDAKREESRPGELAGIWASRAANPLLPKRLRSVKPTHLAREMLKHALAAPQGVTVLESECFQPN